MQASDFRRKKLNLVLALDISGSMGSPFNSYYYDSVTGEQKELSEEGEFVGLEVGGVAWAVFRRQPGNPRCLPCEIPLLPLPPPCPATCRDVGDED